MKTVYISTAIHKKLKAYNKKKGGQLYVLVDKIIAAGMKALKIKK